PPLIAHSLKDAAARSRREVKPLTGEALRACVAHDWNGNVRELKSAVEQALLLSPGSEITPGDLFGQAAPTDGAAPASAAVPNGLPFPEAKERGAEPFDPDSLLQPPSRPAASLPSAPQSPRLPL